MNGVRALRLTSSTFQHGTRRCLATTISPSLMSTSHNSTTPAPAPSTAPPMISLATIEAQWGMLPDDDKYALQDQLDEMQKKDWKGLSLDEKKAAYFVAFGPHGPRAPISKPGDNLKMFAIVAALCGVAGVLKWASTALTPPPPVTMTPEWQEASNERARQQKMNPLAGITSEGYSGKGFVTIK